jgi:hypothetical protein
VCVPVAPYFDHFQQSLIYSLLIFYGIALLGLLVLIALSKKLSQSLKDLRQFAQSLRE